MVAIQELPVKKSGKANTGHISSGHPVVLTVHYQVGCPKYSNNLIFDSLRTFRILRIPDLNIFKL